VGIDNILRDDGPPGDPNESCDRRRKVQAQMIDHLLDRAAHLPPRDRALLELILRDGQSCARLARCHAAPNTPITSSPPTPARAKPATPPHHSDPAPSPAIAGNNSPACYTPHFPKKPEPLPPDLSFLFAPDDDPPRDRRGSKPTAQSVPDRGASALRRRFRRLVRRVQSPEFAFVLEHRAQWTRSMREVATACWIHGLSTRAASNRLRMSLHDVRRHRCTILALIVVASAHPRAPAPPTSLPAA
jgi:hypothetical protein